MQTRKVPKISVVTLNYNGLKYLRKTIPALLNLNYPNLEFIVVDNNSEDGSISFLKKHKSIKLIENEENLGYSKGKNIGVKAAEGEYILLLDNDILVKSKDFLNILISLKEKDHSVIQPLFRDIDNEETQSYGGYYSIYGSNWHKKSFDYNNLRLKDKTWPIGFSVGGIMFFRKTIFKTVGFFDELQKFNLDDFEIGMRIHLYGFKSICISSPYIDVIHLGIEHTKNAQDYARRFQLLYSGKGRAILKNYRTINCLIYFPIMTLHQFLKAIKFSIKKKSFKVLFAFVSSFAFFIKHLPDTLRERKKIQSKRVIEKDEFLKIKPPKFN